MPSFSLTNADAVRYPGRNTTRLALPPATCLPATEGGSKLRACHCCVVMQHIWLAMQLSSLQNRNTVLIVQPFTAVHAPHCCPGHARVASDQSRLRNHPCHAVQVSRGVPAGEPGLRDGRRARARERAVRGARGQRGDAPPGCRQPRHQRHTRPRRRPLPGGQAAWLVCDNCAYPQCLSLAPPSFTFNAKIVTLLWQM